MKQDKFVDEMNELENTALFLSKRYKAAVRPGATKRFMRLMTTISNTRASTHLVREGLSPRHGHFYGFG